MNMLHAFVAVALLLALLACTVWTVATLCTTMEKKNVKKQRKARKPRKQGRRSAKAQALAEAKGEVFSLECNMDRLMEELETEKEAMSALTREKNEMEDELMRLKKETTHARKEMAATKLLNYNLEATIGKLKHTTEQAEKAALVLERKEKRAKREIKMLQDAATKSNKLVCDLKKEKSALHTLLKDREALAKSSYDEAVRKVECQARIIVELDKMLFLEKRNSNYLYMTMQDSWMKNFKLEEFARDIIGGRRAHRRTQTRGGNERGRKAHPPHPRNGTTWRRSSSEVIPLLQCSRPMAHDGVEYVTSQEAFKAEMEEEFESALFLSQSIINLLLRGMSKDGIFRFKGEGGIYATCECKVVDLRGVGDSGNARDGASNVDEIP